MSQVISKSTAKRICDKLTEGSLIAREPNRETFFVSIFVLNNLIQDLSLIQTGYAQYKSTCLNSSALDLMAGRDMGCKYMQAYNQTSYSPLNIKVREKQERKGRMRHHPSVMSHHVSNIKLYDKDRRPYAPDMKTIVLVTQML